jgi:hypothetical protein
MERFLMFIRVLGEQADESCWGRLSYVPTVRSFRARGIASMHKWKWVILTTALALAGLIIGLSRLAKLQKHARDAVVTDAGATTQIQLPADAGTQAEAAPRQPEAREIPSGVDAHPLPANAPNDVVFGAILITFEGVQGAPNKARTKAAALELAKGLLVVAQGNFEDAAKKGDPGSTANAGSIRRGILEPAVEYALFTLDKGAVYPEPIETPRGFWIMRRIR